MMKQYIEPKTKMLALTNEALLQDTSLPVDTNTPAEEGQWAKETLPQATSVWEE